MKGTLTAERRRKLVLSIVLAVICITYVLPIFMVVLNSFKLNTYVKTDTFAFPNGESFAGWANYIKGMTFGNYPFWKSAFYSLFITVVSSALILLCTSMAAWYIARVDSKLCRIIYYLCVFSMVVPFQMVMLPCLRRPIGSRSHTSTLPTWPLTRWPSIPPGPFPSSILASARDLPSSCLLAL